MLIIARTTEMVYPEPAEPTSRKY